MSKLIWNIQIKLLLIQKYYVVPFNWCPSESLCEIFLSCSPLLKVQTFEAFFYWKFGLLQSNRCTCDTLTDKSSVSQVFLALFSGSEASRFNIRKSRSDIFRGPPLLNLPFFASGFCKQLWTAFRLRLMRFEILFRLTPANRRAYIISRS